MDDDGDDAVKMCIMSFITKSCEWGEIFDARDAVVSHSKISLTLLNNEKWRFLSKKISTIQH